MQRPLSELRLHHVKPTVAPGLQPWKRAPRPHPHWGVDDLRLHLTSGGYAPPPRKRTRGRKGAQEWGVPSHPSQGLPPRPSTLRRCGSLIHVLDLGRAVLPTPRPARGSRKAPGGKELCRLSAAAQRPSSKQRSGEATGEKPANRTRLFSLRAEAKSRSSSLNLAFLSTGMKEKRPTSFRGSL